MGFDKVAQALRAADDRDRAARLHARAHAQPLFIILDEAQNTTPEQMKMFLTRIGFGTKAVITGDVTQIDLARGQKSGLIEADRILAGVRGIAFTPLHERRRRAPPARAEDHRRLRARRRAADERRGARGRSARAAARRLSVQYARRARPACPRRATLRRWARRGARARRRGRRCASSASAEGRALNARLPRQGLRDQRARPSCTMTPSRSPATSCCARRSSAREAKAAGQDAARRTARTSSSTACCTCRATTTSAARDAARDGSARDRAPRARSAIADPYARLDRRWRTPRSKTATSREADAARAPVRAPDARARGPRGAPRPAARRVRAPAARRRRAVDDRGRAVRSPR